MIFIDTGAFLARYVARDQHHAVAIDYWQVLKDSRRKCFTSNFVLDETLTLLARRTTHVFAARTSQQLLLIQVAGYLRPDENDEIAAVELFQRYADQSVSFTDCISFVLMRKMNIQCAFTFDHVAVAGFTIEPF